MQNNVPQIDLLDQLLFRLSHLEILNHLILIGSWCMYFYQNEFPSEDFSTLRTRDVDFLVPLPFQSSNSIDLEQELVDLGFLVDRHPKGYIKFLHPELMVDFLTVGRGSLKERPLKVEKLGIHTQSLQLLDILTVDTAQVKYKSTKITIPNPIRFALHKILISTRRPTPEKKEKDLRQGLDLLEICRRNEKYRDQIKLTFERLHKNRQRKISKIVTI